MLPRGETITYPPKRYPFFDCRWLRWCLLGRTAVHLPHMARWSRSGRGRVRSRGQALSGGRRRCLAAWLLADQTCTARCDRRRQRWNMCVPRISPSGGAGVRGPTGVSRKPSFLGRNKCVRDIPDSRRIAWSSQSSGCAPCRLPRYAAFLYSDTHKSNAADETARNPMSTRNFSPISAHTRSATARVLPVAVHQANSNPQRILRVDQALKRTILDRR